jgi:predicted dehydrogenase
MKPLRVGIVGCGVISRGYVETLKPHGEWVRLVGATDQECQRAEDLASSFGGRVYPGLDDMLADEAVDAIVNLTVQPAHYEISARSLAAGKHVYSEKPLALDYRQAAELVALAEREGVRLSCAPMTFLGEAQQAAWQVIRSGRLGRIRVIYADMNWGRPETWHPQPQPYYEVGPLFDIGVYSLTLLTTWFGSARSVAGFGRVVMPERETTTGVRFAVGEPDLVVGFIEFDGGVVARLTTDFYVGHTTRQRGVEVHGDLGSLHLANPQHFNANLHVADYGGEFEPVELPRAPYPGTDWSRGLVDLAEAVVDNRPHRVTGAQAAHVVEIITAVLASIRDGGQVPVTSEFAPPMPLS